MPFKTFWDRADKKGTSDEIIKGVLDSAVRCAPSNVPESSDFWEWCDVLWSLFHSESSIEHESSKDTCNFAFIAVFAFILLFKTSQNYPVYS